MAAGLLLMVLAALCGSACRRSEEAFLRFDAGEGWQLFFPAYLEPGVAPDSGSYYFENRRKKHYLLLRVNPWDALRMRYPAADLTEYYDYHAEKLVLRLESPDAPGPDTLWVHGMQCMKGHIRGQFKGEELYCHLALYRGERNLYQVIYWMPEEEALRYEARADSIFRSLQELPAPDGAAGFVRRGRPPGASGLTSAGS
jgi:hypothetical protein